jgi:hypothetical protein
MFFFMSSALDTETGAASFVISDHRRLPNPTTNRPPNQRADDELIVWQSVRVPFRVDAQLTMGYGALYTASLV